MIKKIKKYLHDIRISIFNMSRNSDIQTRLLQEIYLTQLEASTKNKAMHFEAQVFSQNGEDGITREIMSAIGADSKYFLEIGVDPLVNNTLYLLYEGWKGVWIDAGMLTKQFPSYLQEKIVDGTLNVINSFVTKDNILKVLENNGVPKNIDVISIDIDFNTFYIWQALGEIKAPLVIVEYNASLPKDISWRVDYDLNGEWKGGNYFGASLKAFCELAEQIDYTLIYCEMSGTNAFFVRNDLVEKLPVDFKRGLDNYQPARYFLGRTFGHEREIGRFTIKGN
ncbi:MAG: hypothetical protein WAW36_03190 [Methylovulum miyakonense]|uniref:hypothetical protein n=1 Tax=Methylovulum miyakonense TaxID=645578 RepID=UPI003BB7F594